MSDGDGDIMRDFYTNYGLSPPLTMGNVTQRAQGNGPRIPPRLVYINQKELLTYVFTDSTDKQTLLCIWYFLELMSRIFVTEKGN